MSNVEVSRFLDESRNRVEGYLDSNLPDVSGPAGTIAEAMRYAVLGGGKRIRPALVFAACEAAGGRAEATIPVAAAIEMIHTYSLIHDDLPAMDDDDLRRGQPTVHRKFGEAVAILTGDALHTLAFEWLSRFPSGDDLAGRRTRVSTTLATAAGVAGMVGGQIADLEHEQRPTDETMLAWIHSHKTGALFAASSEVGGILAGADDSICADLRAFGAELGLTFQIADDLLDLVSTAETLGKTPGKDLRAGKTTYPAMFGEAATREMGEASLARARAHLEQSGVHAETLYALAHLALHRSR